MDSVFLYKDVHWSWDNENNRLVFNSNNLQPVCLATTSQIILKTGKYTTGGTIKFRDTVDNLEKAHFKRYYQRRIEIGAPSIISLQDIKDVALFLANRKDLTMEFVQFFHLVEIDRFLRAAIIYFHYYLQVWDKILNRREEATRKLHQPIVTILENILRDNLSDLRSMFAREYCTVILGIGKCKMYHHLSSSTNSLSEKDRRLFEALICMTTKVVWIAMNRRNFPLIELELNNLLRTEFFNLIAHRNRPIKALLRSPEEDRILVGMSNVKESKLKQRSELVKELLLGDHDFRMLGIGFKQFEPYNQRIDYFENLFSAPEETLFENDISIGLIGIPREEYDSMLFPKPRTSKNFDKALLDAINLKIPNKEVLLDSDIPKTFPKLPCKFNESKDTTLARKKQCKMWKDLIREIEQKIEVTSITSLENMETG